MKRRSPAWLWLLLLGPLVLGATRLRFNVEVMDLLPADASAVQGLRLYQENFSNARELVIALRGQDADATAAAARVMAEALRALTNRIADVTWEPPWLEHPAQAADLPAPVAAELINVLAALVLAGAATTSPSP